MKKLPVKKIINWIIGVVISIFALGYFLLIPLFVHFSTGNIGIQIFGATIMALIGLLLLPVMNLLIALIKKKFPKIPEKVYFFFLGVISLLRLAAIIFLTMYVYSSNYFIVKYFQKINPLPVSKAKISTIENFIKADKRSDASNVIQSIPNYEEKLDLTSLQFLNFKRAYNQAISDTLRFKSPKVIKLLNGRLDFYDTRKLILSFGEMDADTSTLLKKYSSVQELAGLSLQYADFYKAQGDSGYKPFLNLAKKLSPSEPQLILYSADLYAKLYNTDKALEEYKKYVDLMEKSGKKSEIPQIVHNYLKNHVPSKEVRDQLYQCYFSGISDNLFWANNDEETIVLNNKSFGKFRGWILDLIFGLYNYSEEKYNGGILSCFSSVKQKKSEATDVSFLESISGINVYQKSGKHFKYINPQIIEWAQNNIIPKPNDRILGTSYQDIYNTLFKDFTREFMYAYWYTERFMDIYSAAREYEDAIADENIWICNHLYEKYGEENPFSPYYSDNIDEGLLSTNVGTLIRRYIDGSYSNCTNALVEIIKSYDEYWYNKHSDSFYPQEEERYYGD